MKLLRLLCIFTIAVGLPVFGQVTISGNLPQNNSTFTLPVTISAKASSLKGISGWAVYFGNAEYYSSQTGLNGILDVSVSGAPTGAGQKVTITAFDNSGAYNSYVATNVTVVASLLPAVPQSATAYTNLQVQGSPGWNYCIDAGCSGSKASSSCSGNVTYGNSSPSLGGASMLQTITGTYCNILNYRKLACPTQGCNAVHNLLEDMWFQTAATNQMQGSEFDPDLFTGTYEYQLSTQCRLVSDGSTQNPAGFWYLWDMRNNKWVPTSYPCTATTIAAGTWHHYQLYGTVDTTNHTQTYETFVFDGKTVFQNLGILYGAVAKSSSAFVNIQGQIDNGGQANPTNTSYYDNYNLWVW